MSTSAYEVIIIGGGFYGSSIALFLANYFDSIVILEKEVDLLTRASYVNQARVHNGYHYPRSFITALRSRVNFPNFVTDFDEAIEKNFEKIYAITRMHTRVNGYQFQKFCKRIGASIQPTRPSIKKLFNSALIEETFSVKEYAFNAVTLREILKRRLEEAGIEIRTHTCATRITQDANKQLTVFLDNNQTMTANHVLNCTYSQINTLLQASGLPLLPFKHEVTEMALVDVPPTIQELGITIMDGPFFSIMPFPPKKLHTLSHVRYTPHYSWHDTESAIDTHAYLKQLQLSSNFPFMIKDVQRFIPSMRDIKHNDSLFEIKTILIQNEIDDGRPILLRTNYGFKNFSVVMGGKIDNIYDVLKTLQSLHAYGRQHGTARNSKKRLWKFFTRHKNSLMD